MYQSGCFKNLFIQKIGVGDTRIVWVRATFADSTIRTHIWSKFNPETGNAEEIEKGWRIDVVHTNYGLDGIDNLAPGFVIEFEKTNYFHEWIELFKIIGYVYVYTSFSLSQYRKKQKKIGAFNFLFLNHLFLRCFGYHLP